MAIALSVAFIKSVQPDPKKVVEVYDAACPGLILAILPTGRKSFVMRFRRADHRMGRLTLGPLDTGKGVAEPKVGGPLTLVAARRLATEVRHQRSKGIDPFEERYKAKHGKRLSAEKAQLDSFVAKIEELGVVQDAVDQSFAVHALAFIEKHAKPHTRRWEETARLLGYDAKLNLIANGLSHRWSMKNIRDVTKRDIVSLLDECRDVTVPGATRRRAPGKVSSGMSRAMAACLSKFFAWLVGRDVIPVSPMAGIAKPKAPSSRDRVLSDEELRKFWTASEKLGYPFGTVFQLLLLTGQRLNEVAGMRRSEIEGDVWRIDASRSKNRKPHYVPILPGARSVIAKATGNNLLFTTTGRTAVSGFSKAKAQLDALIGFDDWVLHDIRRTVATNLAALGTSPVVIEKLLNHVSGVSGGLVGVYQRFSYADEIKVALGAWEVKLNSILADNAELTQMARSRSSALNGRTA